MALAERIAARTLPVVVSPGLAQDIADTARLIIATLDGHPERDRGAADGDAIDLAYMLVGHRLQDAPFRRIAPPPYIARAIAELGHRNDPMAHRVSPWVALASTLPVKEYGR